MKKIIRFEKRKHRGDLLLLMKFDYDKDLIARAKQIPECSWSTTLKAWHLPYSDGCLQQVKEQFAAYAVLDTSGIDQQREKENSPMRMPEKNTPSRFSCQN
jgi:hypothetical protein